MCIYDAQRAGAGVTSTNLVDASAGEAVGDAGGRLAQGAEEWSNLHPMYYYFRVNPPRNPDWFRVPSVDVHHAEGDYHPALCILPGHLWQLLVASL